MSAHSNMQSRMLNMLRRNHYTVTQLMGHFEATRGQVDARLRALSREYPVTYRMVFGYDKLLRIKPMKAYYIEAKPGSKTT